MATSTLGSGTLVLAGTTSGTTTVTATAVAGTTTLTLPAATDTLVGKATTDTLTNKTLGAVTLGGTVAGGGNQINNVIIGTTTPLAGAFTTLSATSNIYTSARYFAQRQSGSLSFAIGGYTNGSAATVLTGAIGDIVAFGNVGGDGVIFANSNTERMRLTDTGLGIGTSSPATKLHVNTGAAGYGITIAANSQTSITYQLGIDSNSNFAVYDTSSAVQRLTLDTSGNLLINTTTSVGGAAKIGVLFAGNATNGINIQDSTTTSGAVFQQFSNSAGTSIGNIARVTTTNAVVYNTTSDYRLKTVTGAVTGQGARIDALKPIDYLWTEGGQQARGFLAHEFQTVYPSSVTGDKDAVDIDGNPKHQAMQASTSEVIADLVAEIQDLRKRLSALESA